MSNSFFDVESVAVNPAMLSAFLCGLSCLSFIKEK